MSGAGAARAVRALGRRLRFGAGGSAQRSLFGGILDWMLAPLLFLWPMSVVLTWLVAQGIANRPYDRELAARVRTLVHEVGAAARGPTRRAAADDRSGTPRLAPPTGPQSPPPPSPLPLSAATLELLGADGVDAVAYQVRAGSGALRAGDAALPGPSDDEAPFFDEVRFRDARLGDTPVRVAFAWIRPAEAADAGAPALVQVAENFAERSRLATEIVKGVLLPQFVVLPLAVLLVWLALARGIAPLSELQQRIRGRDSEDLSPIDVQLAPEEVAPLVRAINDLLTRLDQSIRSQKHFLADAAHQLKTPLAGLRTQAEFAQRQIDAGHHDPQALRKTLQQIARSSQRAAHMVNQLLSMARAENREQLSSRQPVNLARLATEAVRDFVPRALEKRIDLGYEGPANDPPGGASSPRVLGQALLLRELIRNLVDNALQYTPVGGTVTVRVIDDWPGRAVVLQVEDSGPGIAVAERERVFEPFYRALGTEVDGSGLGLAIVREIARQHRAEIGVADARPGGVPPGALIDVRLPVELGPLPVVADAGAGVRI